MKTVSWPVLALSLATLVLLSPRVLRAATDGASDKMPQANKLSTPDELFPLNKHNGILVHIQTIHGTGGKETVRYSLNPTFVAGDQALKKVIADPENANAIELAVAAAGAFRAGDLKEAGLLIFAAQLRESQDLEIYPPKEGETVSTKTLLGMLIGCVKTDVVSGGLQFQPKVLAGVVKRLETLQLKEPADYKPGWDYAKHTAKPDLFAKNKANLMGELKPTSDLLLMPEYFAAFKCYCEFNELRSEMQKSPANVKSRAQAIKTMKRVEREKDLQGIMYQVEHAEVN
jgi:hypothetical protein